METSSVALRLMLAAGAVIGGSGCTRTYDGSIVPAYETRLDSGGFWPRLEFQEVDVEPPNRFYKFPPRPAAPVVVSNSAQTDQRPAPRRIQRQPAQTVPQQRPETPGIVPALFCENKTSPSGRVRVVCT